MKSLHAVFLAGVATLVPEPSIAGEAKVAPCVQRLSPVHAVAPRLPPGPHNEFEGTALVEYIVGVDGRVQSPRIVSATWKPIGHSRGQPVGYAEAILAAVGQWRFVAQIRPCRNRTPMDFTFDESDGAAVTPVR